MANKGQTELIKKWAWNIKLNVQQIWNSFWKFSKTNPSLVNVKMNVSLNVKWKWKWKHNKCQCKCLTNRNPISNWMYNEYETLSANDWGYLWDFLVRQDKISKNQTFRKKWMSNLMSNESETECVTNLNLSGQQNPRT